MENLELKNTFKRLNCYELGIDQGIPNKKIIFDQEHRQFNINSVPIKIILGVISLIVVAFLIKKYFFKKPVKNPEPESNNNTQYFNKNFG
jgi:hypothetical protein